MEKQRIYDIIIQNLPVGFSVVDEDGIIVDFNSAAEAITGYRRDEVLGKQHVEILHGALDKDACPLFRHALSRQERVIAVETSIKRKNNEQINLSVTAFPLLDEQGGLAGAVEIFRDITEIKRLERERRNILSMFAHDMKNPITTSGGFLSRLLSGKAGVLTTKQQSYLETMRDELYKVSDLLADFLEFSRIEAKAYVPNPRPFNMEDEVRRNVEAAKLEADRKGITVFFEAAEKIAPVILADPAMISRVVANLLDNAIAYTDGGGNIHIRLSEQEGEIKVSIADTGRGIPEDQIPYIFDAFYRISRDTKGSGLGLFIVKTIVEAHGGRISVESAPGKGSIFSVMLPKN